MSWEIIEPVQYPSGQKLPYRTMWMNAMLSDADGETTLDITMLDFRILWAQSAPSCDFGQVGERFGNVAFGIDDGNHRRGQFAPS